MNFSRHVLLPAGLFLLLLLLKLPGVPTTVQTLDTGELVTNAGLLRVIHPPGYPLYTWIYHVFIKIFPVGTVFFRASLLTFCFSLVVIFLHYSSWKRVSPFLAALLALGLSLSHPFGKYALLPDLFMLHLLFVAGLSYLYLFRLFPDQNQKSPPSPEIFLLMNLLFFIGLAHHPTLIFLLPLVIHAGARCFFSLPFKKWLLRALAPLPLFLGLYLSLLTLNGEALTSWGHLKNLPDLVKHVLRMDYGPFQLAVSGPLAVPPLSNFLSIAAHFLSLSFLDLLFPVGGLLAFFISRRERGPVLLYFSCLILVFFIFFPLANVVPRAMGGEILERFYLMPLLMLSLLGARVFPAVSGKLRVLLPLLGILIGLHHFFFYRAAHDFSRNTVIEDWAINRLTAIPPELAPRTLLLESSDTGLFSLYYVQEVLGIGKAVTVLSPQLLFYSWYPPKIRTKAPSFVFEDKRISLTRKMNLDQDLIRPNLDHFAFNVVTGIPHSPQYKMTFLPLGKMVERGQGTFFRPAKLRRTPVLTAPTFFSRKGEFFHDHYFFGHYAFFDLAWGMGEIAAGNATAAQAAFLQALEKVPFCVPALEKICQILEVKGSSETASCKDKLQIQREETFPYFSSY